MVKSNSIDLELLQSIPEEKAIEFLADLGFQRTVIEGKETEESYDAFMKELRSSIPRGLALKVGKRMLDLKIQHWASQEQGR